MDDRTSPPPAAHEGDQAAPAAGRDALRARIAEEIARQNAYPVAERTLSLLAEASLAPLTEAPFYRVVDRAGAPRLLTEVDGRTVPMPIEALFAELRDRHPALFLPPPPEPEPAPAPQAEPVPAEDFSVATARFVGAQSVVARSLVARSLTRGRTTAQAISTAISERAAALRPQRAAVSDPAAAPLEARAPAEPGRSARALDRLREGTRGLSGYARGRIADTTSRLRDVARDRNTLRDALSRRALPLGLILGGVALVALVTAIGGRNGTEEEASAPETRSQAQVQPPAAAGNPPSAPDMSPALPEENQPKPARANELTGPVEVIDTATLRVAGKLVRLFGVEWVRGGQADELTRYLAGRTVTCRPVAGSEARLCAVDGRDLSEVVLFNGGGRASPEATPDLVAAEDHARAERLGVWAR
ncbi:hypothetical protein MKK58_00835 [Methylobacterium sp. J-078]|uniref:thermonuclease family protein n=1 Tax=Methylobacterium sp. J-078 TaxID=2836657 RepID=UPI001FBAD56D|nr:hypothetical protein [Methylobacterium sp. J-078]MCJ2043099.1 hypothetical protein [Methylobacterium sp. J-078]